MLGKKLAQALNEQINRELQAAYLYFSMSIYCDSRNMDGFSNWLRVQSQEETQHAMKIYDYLRDMDGKAQLLPIPQPQTDFSSFLEVFERAVESEKTVAADLNAIANLALEEKDQITYSFLKWFLDEQVEEIATTSAVVEKIKLVGDNGYGLLMINEELGRRVPEQEA